jgi:phosphomannomutase
MDRDIVLFDMDGTLTEPRKAFVPFLSSPLWNLAKHADIGIVTGSDYDYVKQQLSHLLSDHSIRYCLHILPCNGTKHYKPVVNAADTIQLDSQVSMEDELGKEKYRSLIEVLLCKQLSQTELDIPLTGHFISPRGSMVNWSPSGRNANDKERNKFKKFDKKYGLRNRLLKELKTTFYSAGLDNLTVKLGGDTSFDIYPTGWDKTYALRHFSGRNVWFVGDRAHSPKGNDYEIFKACEPRSFHTSGPEETVEIIEKIISKMKV